MNVYYNKTTNEIYIDKGSRTTTIKLPNGINSLEVTNILQSDTLTAVINQLTN